MNSVTQLIIQSFEHVDKHAFSGKLGVKFLEMLDRDKEKAKKDALSADVDAEFIKKVELLTTAENNKNLAWMDRSSWSSLSFEARLHFEALVEPLVLGSGIYFEHSKFQTHHKKIIAHNDKDSILYSLRDGVNYCFLCVSLDSNKYNWIGPNEFKNLLIKYQGRWVQSFSNSSDGVLVKDFIEEVQVTQGGVNGQAK